MQEEDSTPEIRGNSLRRSEQRYPDESPDRIDRYQQLKRPIQEDSMVSGTNRVNYRSSDELAQMFKPDSHRKDGEFWQWDNNTRGQRVKQDYHRYVSQELERERQTNPRLKKLSKQSIDDSSGYDLIKTSNRERQSINPYLNSLSLPSLKINQRQYPQQQEFASRKSAKQESYANDLLEQVS